MVTLKQLQVLLSVARLGTLSAAAESLFMTKGALSQALAQLESNLAEPLFDRIRGRLVLNEQGQTLLPLADELLTRSREIETLFDKPSRQLRLGCSRTIAGLQLPELLRQFSAQEGWLPQLVIDNSTALFEQLLNFELDIAMIEAPSHHPLLVQQHWQDDEMVILAGAGHPLAWREQVGFAELATYPWILREQGSGSRDYFEQQLAPLIGHPQAHLEVDSLGTLCSCVANQLGLTFASKALLSAPGYQHLLSQVHCPQRFIRKLFLSWHRDKYLSRNAQLWRDLACAGAQSESIQSEHD